MDLSFYGTLIDLEEGRNGKVVDITPTNPEVAAKQYLFSKIMADIVHNGDTHCFEHDVIQVTDPGGTTTTWIPNTVIGMMVADEIMLDGLMDNAQRVCYYITYLASKITGEKNPPVIRVSDATIYDDRSVGASVTYNGYTFYARCVNAGTLTKSGMLYRLIHDDKKLRKCRVALNKALDECIGIMKTGE